MDRLYRGRKLAQAVKVLALRYARDVLKANTVRHGRDFFVFRVVEEGEDAVILTALVDQHLRAMSP